MKDTATYIASMCLELCSLARNAQQPFLAHLLEMAHMEAKQKTECVSDRSSNDKQWSTAELHSLDHPSGSKEKGRTHGGAALNR